MIPWRTLRLVVPAVLSFVMAWNTHADDWNPLQSLLVGHQSLVTHVALSPDGRTIVSGNGAGKRIVFWEMGDALTMRLIVNDPLCRGAVPVGFARDGRMICITRTQPSGSIVAFDPVLSKAEVIGEGSFPADLSFDGRWLATREPVAELSTALALWDLKTFSKVATVLPPATGEKRVQVLMRVQFRSDSLVVAGQYSDSSIHSWSVESKAHQDAIDVANLGPVRMEFDASGKVVATPETTPRDPDQIVRAVVESPDRTLEATLLPRSLSVKDRSKDQIVATASTSTARIDRLGQMRFSGDGKRVVTVDQHGPLVLDVTTGKTWTFHRPAGDVRALAYSPDGKRLASARGNAIEVWELTSSGNPQRLEGRLPLVESVAFHPQLPLLASGHIDGTVRLWNLSTRESRTLTGHTRSVMTLAFHPDGKSLATGGFDRTVRLWDADSGDLLRVLNADGPVRAVAFSPDGHSLAAGNHAKSIDIWNTTTWEGASLTGHAGPVMSLAFTSDGKTLVSASASHEATLRWWDMSSREPILSVDDSIRQSWAVRVTPDGKHLAVIDSDENNNCRLCLRDATDGHELASTLLRADRQQPSNERPSQHATLELSPDGLSIATSVTQESIDLFALPLPKQGD